MTEHETEYVRTPDYTLPEEQRNPVDVAKVIKKIITESRRNWDQGKWFQFTQDDEGELDLCGSTGCVAGWASLLNFEGAYFRSHIDHLDLRSTLYVHEDKTWASERGREALDLSADESDWLFAADREEDDVLAALDVIIDGGSLMTHIQHWERG